MALQKAKVLNENGIVFHTISEEFIGKFFGIFKIHKNKRFEPNDLEHFDYVIDATGNQRV